MDKIIVGSIEEVTVINQDKQVKVQARMDTGATISSIDVEIAAELGLGPVIDTKKVKSSHGKTIRPVIEAEIILKGKRIQSEFSLIDRSHMTYPMLVGRNILENDFVVDVTK